MELGGTPFTTHKRAEREFDAERTSADRFAAIADLDVVQHETWRRQQSRVDVARHTHFDTDQPARLSFEQSTMTAPVEQQWSYQRRDERQDDRNRQSEQCGLQRQLQRQTASGIHPRSAKYRPELPLLPANLCRGTFAGPTSALSAQASAQ